MLTVVIVVVWVVSTGAVVQHDKHDLNSGNGGAQNSSA